MRQSSKTARDDLRTTSARAYEKRLDADPGWALSEGSLFFEGKGAVQEALRKITSRLNELGIPYAIVGGMALFRHGYRRFTEDIDILVTRAGLCELHRQIDGRGYLPPFAGSKNLRDADLGVKIEFLVAGGYPGDGKPKPVSFPDPSSGTIVREGIKYVDLPVLIELKLASGMTDPGRARDLVDVEQLIKLLDLPANFAARLNPYVRPKFTEIWNGMRAQAKRYKLLWRNKWLTADAKSLPDMIQELQVATQTLQAMLADGVVLDSGVGTSDDYAHLITTDPEVAKKYGMHEESEFLDERTGGGD